MFGASRWSNVARKNWLKLSHNDVAVSLRSDQNADFSAPSAPLQSWTAPHYSVRSSLWTPSLPLPLLLCSPRMGPRCVLFYSLTLFGGRAFRFSCFSLPRVWLFGFLPGPARQTSVSPPGQDVFRVFGMSPLPPPHIRRSWLSALSATAEVLQLPAFCNTVHLRSSLSWRFCFGAAGVGGFPCFFCWV